MIGGHSCGSGVHVLRENLRNMVHKIAEKASEQTTNIILIPGSRRTRVTQEGRADEAGVGAK